MSRMREYLNQHIILMVLRRLVSLIPILLGVTILTYGLMYISPQDPVEMMLQGQGTAPDPEVVRPCVISSGWIGRFWYSILTGCGDLYVETWEFPLGIGKAFEYVKADGLFGNRNDFAFRTAWNPWQ